MNVNRIALCITAAILLLLPGLASAQPTIKPLAFSGDFSALDLGFDSKWWPGETEQPGGSPVQVRISALAVADVDSEFAGSVALDGDTLTLGQGGGWWGYDFGASVFMDVAFNLTFTIPNPFGSDFKIGPWVIDIPYAPDFDLVNSQSTTLDSWLLDSSSTLSDVTEPVKVYDLSLIEYILGGINIPDWAVTILQLDAGAALNVAIGTEATLAGNAIHLSDGNSFTSEAESKSVEANAPAYSVTANYEEDFKWDLELFFKPSVFIDILGQRFELPIITIPWKVLKDGRDLTYTQGSLEFPVSETPGEGEGAQEGEGETGEGEEGETGDVTFPTGCPAVCQDDCTTDDLDVNLISAITAVYADLVVDIPRTDADGNGIADYTQFLFLDSVLLADNLSAQCCVVNAWKRNLYVVNALIDPAGTAVYTDLQKHYIATIAGFATLGEPGGYDYINVLAAAQGWNINLSLLEPAAGHYVGAQGDADMDGVCNLGEYDFVGGDAVNFVLAATDYNLRQGVEACNQNCGASTEGEVEGGDEGEQNQRWTLTIIKEGNGSGDVLVSPDQEDFENGQLVTLTVVLGRNTIVTGWRGVAGVQLPGENGGEVQHIQGSNQYTIVMNGNKVIRPHFYLFAPVEGEDEGEHEGGEEGEPEGGNTPRSSADVDGDGIIGLGELLRLIQLYNNGAYFCGDGEDGYDLTPQGGNPQNCVHHSSDYSPADWVISLTEMLRLVQFYNLGGYIACDNGEDGFCVISR
jgi:hypothetical protein